MRENVSEKIKKMSMKTLIGHMKNAENIPDKRFCFILGAGASKQSGIPTGRDLAEKWLKELENLYDAKELDTWKESKGITEKNIAENYSNIYEKRFEIDSSEGYYYIQDEMRGINPSFGYSVLVQVLTKTLNNVVITTNFDSLVEDAMFIYTDEKPLVCGHESLTSFIKPIMSRPLVAKIHRDLFFAPKSTVKDTSLLDEHWKEALTNIFKFYTPIVIGYGGNDGSLMDFLSNIGKINGGLFWCCRNLNPDELNEKIKALVLKHNGYLVNIDGFDEFFVHVNEKYDYKLLDEKIVNVANNKANIYRDQFKKLTDSEKTEETNKSLKNIIKKNTRTWWTIQLEIYDVEEDVNKQGELYEKGIKEFPNSSGLMGNYANFLRNIKKDYDKSEEYYKRALEIDPKNDKIIGNYGILLYDIKKDYNKAEEYLKRAIELDPKSALHMTNYAELLKDVKKDYDKAEEYLKKAIKLDPKYVNAIKMYISILKDIRNDPVKAKEYEEKLLAIE